MCPEPATPPVQSPGYKYVLCPFRIKLLLLAAGSEVFLNYAILSGVEIGISMAEWTAGCGSRRRGVVAIIMCINHHRETKLSFQLADGNW